MKMLIKTSGLGQQWEPRQTLLQILAAVHTWDAAESWYFSRPPLSPALQYEQQQAPEVHMGGGVETAWMSVFSPVMIQVCMWLPIVSESKHLLPPGSLGWWPLFPLCHIMVPYSHKAASPQASVVNACGTADLRMCRGF